MQTWQRVIGEENNCDINITHDREENNDDIGNSDLPEADYETPVQLVQLNNNLAAHE